jgi:cytochrome c1
MNGLLSFKPTNNDCDFERIAKKQDQMFHRVATSARNVPKSLPSLSNAQKANRSLFAARWRWRTSWKK